MSPPIARRSAAARRGQLALIAGAVALAVALSVASFEFAHLMGRALGTQGNQAAAIIQAPAGAVILTADTSAATASTALDDALVDQLRTVPGVLEVAGRLDQPVSFRLRGDRQPERPAALRGVVFSAPFGPPWELLAGRAPQGPDEVAVDVGGAVVGQLAVGSQARLDLPTGRRRVQVVGLVSVNGETPTAADGLPALTDAHVLLDPAVMATVLGAEGRVDRITVLPQPGMDLDELADRITAEVGDGLRVTATTDPNAVAQQTAATIDAGVQQGTQLFALLTAGVAVIVVANVFAVVLAPRTRELALLRLVGATRAQLIRWLLGEALLVGLVATIVGFALGVPLGAAVASVVPAGSAELGHAITTPMLVVAPVVGVGVTLLGALLPVRRASSVPPVRALAEQGDRGRSVNRVIVSVLGGGIGLIARALTRLTTGTRRAVPAMASGNVRRRPAATAAAASTLLVGLVLVGAVATAGASIRTSLATQYDAESRADAYVQRRGVVRVDRDSIRAEIDAIGLPIDGAAEVVSVDGLLLASGRTENRVVAADLAAIPSVIDLGIRAGAVGGPGSALLAQATAEDLGLRVGDALSLRSTSGSEVGLTVSGTYANTAFYGPAIVDIADAQAIGADGTFEMMAVRFTEGTDTRWATWALEDTAVRFPRVNVSSPEEFVALNTSVATTVLRIVGVLLGGALGIGAVGLTATLSLGVLERRTELSRLRAMGASMAQVQSLVTLEAVLICLGASAWGLGIGAVIGWFGLGFAPPELVSDRVIPWDMLVGAGLGAMVLGAAVSLLPARRAASVPLIGAASH